MMKGVKIKQEYQVLAMLLILIVASYLLAIKKTINAIETHSRLTSAVATSGSLSYQPDYLMRKNKNLDKIINKYKADSIAVRDTIVTVVSTIAAHDDINMVEVPSQDISLNTSHYFIQRFDFEGSYFNLLKLLNHLELYNGIGVLRSIEWKNISTKLLTDEQPKLHLEIYLEIIK